MKILIKNGMIISGKLEESSFVGDLLIENDRILKIGNIEEKAETVIDASGKLVTPGFIDTHSHSDLSILLDPYNEIKIRQGVTTEILGQDGISMAPLPEKWIKKWRNINRSFNGDSDDIDWSYNDTKGYLDIMRKKGIGLNEGYLVPHGNVRLEVIGTEDVIVTEENMKNMCEVVRRELKNGALGLSTGLIYNPCMFGDKRELIELCKVVEEFDGVFVVHQRSEADYILESMEEIIDVGRKTGVRIHFSHFKVCGKKNWKYIDEIFQLMDKAKNEGIKLSFDQYPYVAGSTSLGVVLPPWTYNKGGEELLKELKNSEFRKKIIRDIKSGIDGWDNFIDFAGFENIFITSVKGEKNKNLIGKNLLEISEIRRSDPYNATLDLIYEEDNSIGMIDYYGLEEHIIKFMKRPEQNICTDGLVSKNPHPRLYGSFTKVLEKYVKEEKSLLLEEAIYKMSKKPAETFKLEGRGYLKEGNFADIIIFDLNNIKVKSTYIDPKKYSEGIDYVLINGEIVLNRGRLNRALPGKVL